MKKRKWLNIGYHPNAYVIVESSLKKRDHWVDWVLQLSDGSRTILDLSNSIIWSWCVGDGDSAKDKVDQKAINELKRDIKGIEVIQYAVEDLALELRDMLAQIEEIQEEQLSEPEAPAEEE